MRLATDPLEPTWYEHELPILRHVVAQFESDRPRVTAGEISSEIRIGPGSPGLDRRDTDRALRRLEREGLITMYWSGKYEIDESRVVDFDSRAYALVGRWPSPDTITDRLLSALGELAENGEDAVTKSRAKDASKALDGISREVLVSMIGAAAGVKSQ